MATEAEIAWMAGLFEGEGTIYTFAHNKTGRRKLQLRIVMTDEDVLLEMARRSGMGKVIPKKGSYTSNSKNKQAYVWQLSRETEIRSFLAMILPWLGHRRMVQAFDALAACDDDLLSL